MSTIRICWHLNHCRRDCESAHRWPSTLFSPEKNRTSVIKFIILVWPEGRILGRVRERGVGDPPVYKPYSGSGTSYQLETSVRQHESVLGRYRAVKVLCPVWPKLAPVTGQKSSFLMGLWLVRLLDFITASSSSVSFTFIYCCPDLIIELFRWKNQAVVLKFCLQVLY